MQINSGNSKKKTNEKQKKVSFFVFVFFPFFVPKNIQKSRQKAKIKPWSAFLVCFFSFILHFFQTADL